MAWFYNLLMEIDGFNSTAASWATAAVAVLLVYAVISIFRSWCK